MKQLFISVSLFGLLCCSKPGDSNTGQNPGPNPNPGNPQAEITITTISPNSAEFVPVTINGTGFSTTAANNVVRIGGIPATVTKATDKQLEITLPANLNAGDHDVSVTVSARTATKTKGFHLIGWIVSNFAGTGDFGSVNGAGNQASFRIPSGIAMDNDGNFIVPDRNMIRKITPQGEVSTIAGADASGHKDANGANARFAVVTSAVLDANNNIYVADQLNHCIRKITPAGDVTTVAGDHTRMGSDDGFGEKATFSLPYGVTINAAGTHLYVGDLSNNIIRRIDLATREVITIAGNGSSTRKDAAGLAAGIPSPGNLAFDQHGNLFITEKGGGKVRKMEPNGNVTTVGGPSAQQDVVIAPTHIAIDKDDNLFVTFSGMALVKKYSPAGAESTFAGAFTGPDVDDGPVNVVQFRRPEGIAIKYDAQGNAIYYVVDSQRKKIKMIRKQ